MRQNVNNIRELASYAHDPNLFWEIVNYINQEMEVEGELFTSESEMSMVAYHLIDYKNTYYDGKWPLLAIAPQKNTINVYAFVLIEGHYVAETFAEVFGKSNVGKLCIRIRKMNSERYTALKTIIGILKK